MCGQRFFGFGGCTGAFVGWDWGVLTWVLLIGISTLGVFILEAYLRRVAFAAQEFF